MASSAGRAGFSDEINFPQWDKWDNSGTFPHAFGALFEILGLESNAPRAHRRVRNWPAKIEFY
jgi:hypothetical protein